MAGPSRIAVLVIALGISALIASPTRAAVLYDNGDAAAPQGQCDQTNAVGPGACTGGTGFTIYDDFTLSSNSIVTGFTYNSYVPVCDCGNLLTDYTGTSWSIWAVDPKSNYPTGPVVSGTTVGTLSSGAASSILITVAGLSIDLGPGEYWLGTSNDEELAIDVSNYAKISGSASDAEQSNQAGTFTNINLPDAAFTIEGTAPVPEPASLAIFGVGLASFGWVRRRRKTR